MLGKLLILLGMVLGYYLAFNYFKTSVGSEEEIMQLEKGDFRRRAVEAQAATREKSEELENQIGSMFEDEEGEESSDEQGDSKLENPSTESKEVEGVIDGEAHADIDEEL